MSLALDLEASDRVAFVFPFTHIGGINWLQAGLAAGCTQILIENFADAETIPTLRRHGVTLATAGTVFHEAYLKAQHESRTSPLFPNVRAFPGGGAGLSEELLGDGWVALVHARSSYTRPGGKIYQSVWSISPQGAGAAS